MSAAEPTVRVYVPARKGWPAGKSAIEGHDRDSDPSTVASCPPSSSGSGGTPKEVCGDPLPVSTVGSTVISGLIRPLSLTGDDDSEEQLPRIVRMAAARAAVMKRYE